jgi:hypothetical protein
MRSISFLFATLFVVCVNPTYSFGQGGDERRAEEPAEPYHKHHDTRHGHDHFYPDRGSVIRDLPKGTIGVNYAGVSYRFHDGVWLEPRGPAFIVVAPPIGLVVPSLPTFTTLLAHGGDVYLYANDVYYRPRPDLGGYQVVNDPAEGTSSAGAESVAGTLTSGALPATPQAAAAPIVAPAVISAPVATPVQAAVAAAVPLPSAAVTPSVAAAAIPPTQPAAAIAQVPQGAAAAIPPAPAPAATIPASIPAPTAAAVVLPAGSSSAAAPAQPKGPKVFLYPKNGQSADQQARDRFECYRFAVAQSGFDPMRAPGGVTATQNAEPQSDYERAQAACFDARGYTIR